ncbi:MAG: nucleoside phosphorylase [Erysipelotrichaceae bacterium]|nr:nucleoside phosphorylase [Erysipelotrichaceae bacterium]
MRIFRKTEAMKDKEGRLLFTGLRPGDLAETVLLPGDPHRSKVIADQFKEVRYVGQRSTFAAYTGKTEMGTPVSVVSSGMGCMCVAAAMEEFAHLGVKNVIRVGTCAGLQPDIEPGTLSIATGCVRGEGASYEYVPGEYPAVADYRLVQALEKAAKEAKEPYVLGLYRSHDSFYMESMAAHEGLWERMDIWQAANVVSEENESGTLFPLGYLLGIRTATICVVLGYMLAEADPGGRSNYPVYTTPHYLEERVDAETKIVLRAIDLLAKEDLS